MARELERLRHDYHQYATSAPADGMPITFDGLVSILDKIIAVKRDMESSSCKKIPPRRKMPEGKTLNPEDQTTKKTDNKDKKSILR